MKEFIERRDNKVTRYTVSIDERMRSEALDFAKKIILTDNQYSRLLPIEVHNSRDISLEHKIEIQRTYMGKLGEMAFVKFLHENNKNVNVDGMLDIYEGQENVDSFDFMTCTGRSVDIKTGFRSIHKRLLVNTDQFDNIPKDCYVAVKLDAIDTNSQQKLVDWDDVLTATIIGYADYDYLKVYAKVYNFGEGPARWIFYDELIEIDRLLDEF